MTSEQVWRCFQSWLPELAQKVNRFSSAKTKNTIYIYMNSSENSNGRNHKLPLIFTVSAPNQWSLKTEKG